MNTLPKSIPASPYADLPSTQNHIERAAQFVAGAFVESVQRSLGFTRSLESPIEALFLVWWAALQEAHRIADDVYWKAQHEIVASSGRTYRLDFVMEPQCGLRERAEAFGMRVAKIAVEVDGHDFHERTKEQVAYRNQRDRDLQADGWVVLHFSGSEIYRDPVKCIEQVYDQASPALGWLLERRVVQAELDREAAALKDGQAV